MRKIIHVDMDALHLASLTPSSTRHRTMQLVKRFVDQNPDFTYDLDVRTDTRSSSLRARSRLGQIRNWKRAWSPRSRLLAR